MEQIVQLIHANKNFVVAGHISPDGDAIGSCFALAFALEKLGKNVSVMLESYPQRYNILPGNKFLLKEQTIPENIDVLIALDSADAYRLGPGQILLQNSLLVKHSICIDHHKTNPGFADVNHIEPQASSTSEIVFRLIELLLKPEEICQDIATNIYAGILCDTGGFKYNSTAPSTLQIAARLINTGIPFTHLYNELLHTHTFAAGKAKGIVMQNATTSQGGKIVSSIITREELASAQANSADLDGIVEYLLNTNSAQMAALVYQKTNGSENEVKISLRSHGPDVGNVAAKLGGGGHQMAAGATTTGVPAKVLAHVLELMAQEMEENSYEYQNTNS